MPFLVVLGSGSWSPLRGHRFDAGVHEVSDEIAQLARAEGAERLIVSDSRPEVVVEDGSGELTRDDIVFGTVPGSVRLVQPDPEPDAEEVVESLLVDDAFVCPWCPAPFPSKAARGRHIWKHHASAEEPEPEAEAEGA